MINSTKVLALAAVTVLGFATAGAQDAPVAPNLRGTVRSVSGNPIDGVEVRVEGTSLATRSDRTGTFAFVKAPKGTQLLLFRLLGYLPVKAEAHVPSTDNDTLDVTMLPTPRALDTVKVVASMNILAGIVVDHKNTPIPDATIEMISAQNHSTATDAGGWFTFTSVRSGTVLVRARKLGYAPVTTSLRLEDWRGLVIHLEPLDYTMSASKLETMSGFGNTNTFVWTETQQRIGMRGMHAIVVPREELAPYDDFSLGEAIRRTKTGAMLGFELNALGTNACVLLNGRTTVGPATLETFHTDDVEFVEVYPPGSEISGSVAQYLNRAGCRRVRLPGSLGAGFFYVVIWARS